MSATASCSLCGLPVTAASPGGLCTRCLFQRFAFSDSSPGSGSDLDLELSPKGIPLLGDYELLEVIGRGGMGVVYRARQRAANRIVAVKLIAAGDLASPEIVRRFQTEAETAASLDHPGIVPVHEVGEFEGRHFFSMRLVTGDSLAARLNKIRNGQAASFSAEASARMVETLAGAVQYAHERGVLHRDIKPGNIMLDEQDQPSLTDFGLAKLILNDSAATRSLALVGTPAYMAPEQAAEQPLRLTTSVDVYGLGTVLYELLTGQQPFQASTSFELIRKVVEAEPTRPSRLNPGIDADIETICLKCLQKQPAHRYATAGMLADDLRRWRNHEPITARTPGLTERARKWSRRHPALAALAVVCFLAALIVVQQEQRYTASMRIERDTAKAAQQRAEATVLNQQLTHADQLLQSGKTADALTEWARVLRNHLTNIVAASRIFSTLSHRNFVIPAFGTTNHPTQAFTIEYSPDGRRLLFSNRSITEILDAKTWRPASGTGSLPAPVHRARWSRDGESIAAIDSQSAWLRDARTFTPVVTPFRMERWSVPALTEDGRFLAVTGGEGPEVWIQDLASGRMQLWGGDASSNRRLGSAILTEPPRILIPGASAVSSWAIKGSGALDLHQSLTKSIRRIRLRPGIPVAIFEMEESEFQFWNPKTLEKAWPSLSLGITGDDDLRGDGLLYASAQPERWGQLWNLHTGERLGEPALRSCASARVRFAPGGEHLLLFGDLEGVHFCDARDGTMRSHAFRHRESITHAEFSPDSRYLATSSEDGTARVWHSDTSVPLSPPLAHPAKVRSIQFSSDGLRLVSVDTANTARVWEPASGRLIGQPLTEQEFVHAALLDPTGSWLALCTAKGFTLHSLATPSTPPFHGEPECKIPCGQFSEDGSRLLTLAVTPDERDWIRLWKPGETNPVWSLQLSNSCVRATMPPNASHIAVAADDATIRIWNTASRQTLGSTMRHKDQVWVLAFSRDGRRLLSAGADRKAQVWDTATGDPLGEPMLHESAVWQAQFSPDESRVLTSTERGIARIWDSNSGHPLTEPFAHHPVAVHIIMSPSTTSRFTGDGRQVVLPCDDNAARILQLPPSDPPPVWLPEFVEAIAGQQWRSSGLAILPWSDFYAIRLKLQQEATGGPWLAWAQWFLADRSSRTVSPYSSQRVTEYAGELVREGSVASLLEALRMEPSNRLALETLARLWLRETSAEFPARRDIARHLLDRAASLAPASAP